MSSGKFISAGVFSAIAASLCCIMPVLALIVGAGSLGSSFSWIAPARPYLIGVTIVVLGLAWFGKLKQKPIDECGCAVEDKPGFLQSKTFLLFVSLFAALMIGFPSYSKSFFPNKERTTFVAKKSNIRTVELAIKGMTCKACEDHVNRELNKLPGIVESNVSYKNKSAIIQFDLSGTNIQKIIGAVNKTGYKVINHSIIN